MRSIERLEKRRDSINKRLDGVEKFDEVRHKGMKAAVDLVQERYGKTLSDDELVEVKEELDKQANPSGVWETISDFGINLFVDVAVLYARNRGKFLTPAPRLGPGAPRAKAGQAPRAARARGRAGELRVGRDGGSAEPGRPV